MNDCVRRRCPTAHCDVQYSVESPPLYQTKPLCGVSNANHAVSASWTAHSAASNGSGRARLRYVTPRAAASSARERVLPIPRNRSLEALAERGGRAEAEPLGGARRVEVTSRLPVRHRCVPRDLAGEAGQLGDQLGELADCRLDAGAEVDRLRVVVAICGEQQAVHAVLDVEELACRRAVAPENDLLVALEHLADQRGDDMRGAQIEVVA